MIGEGDVVQVMLVVVGVESAPAAVAALQAEDPFATALDRLAELGGRRRVEPRPGAVHRHDDDGGVVEVGVMRIGVLERPAARPHVGPLRGPVAGDVEDLLRLQPGKRLSTRRCSASSLPTSSSAWLASAVSQIGDRQGWQ